jgi:hypothetical protein
MQRPFRHATRTITVLFSAAGLAVVLQPTDLYWWPVRLAGVAALLSAAAAIASPPSPRRQQGWHRTLGWLAVAAVSVHILLVAWERKLWHWLSPAMPIEIILGIAAAACLALTLAVRRSRALRVNLGPLATLGLHRIAGVAGCITASAHIALAAGTSNAVILLLSGGGVALLATGPSREKYAWPVAIALALAAGGGAALAVGPLAALRLEQVRLSPIDHARFSHVDHDRFRCTTCHHNFVDRTGKENCMNCHKRLTRDEPMRIDRLFHRFCGDCHEDERRAGKMTGPIDHCSGCHEGRRG